MSVINPFCALRPAPGMVADVATHSVERYSKDEINHILASNPVSFMQVINPNKGKQPSNTDLHDIKKRFNEFVSKNIFIRDNSPCIYIYRQIKNGIQHTGFIGLASVEDYDSNTIKIHEQTLSQKEEMLKEYLDVCEFNAEPVCLTYPHNNELTAIMKVKMQGTPVYDYVIEGIRHSVWIINRPEEIELIQALFKKIPALYIADGHHRAASSARLAEKRKASNPAHNGKEPYNYFTAAFFAEDELKCYAYHRIVRDLNGHSPESFINELRKKFNISILENPSQATRKKMLSIYVMNQWYAVDISNLIQPMDPVKNLDVSILSDYILSPVLDINDLRNDKRISFIPGIKSKKEIEEVVDSGKFAAAFCLYPVSFEELLAVANSGNEMPPKSTWIEPKLESGLLIYSL